MLVASVSAVVVVKSGWPIAMSAFALFSVLAVIYAFLGSLRATLIPAVTIPVSIIASFIVMYAMGFSLNLLTILAIVLSVGLVVGDGMKLSMVGLVIGLVAAFWLAIAGSGVALWFAVPEGFWGEWSAV